MKVAHVIDARCTEAHLPLRSALSAALLILLSFSAACSQSSGGASVPVVAAPPREAESAEQRRRNTMALHAKLLCSAVFISGRSADSVVAEDLQWREYRFHDWARTQATVDTRARRVTVGSRDADHTPTYTAEYNPTLGCSLLPPGADHVLFTPADAGSHLPSAETQDWPNGDRIAPPRANSALEAMLDDVFDDTHRAHPQNTRALIVLQDGEIAAERYAPGFSRDMPLTGWSMGKSVAAALLGVLVQETGLDIDAPAPISEWRRPGDPRRAITTRHLLNMAGGLAFQNPDVDAPSYYTDAHEHESVYFRAQNTEQFVINRPLQYPPGSVFQYRNTNTLALMSIIRRANARAGKNHLTWPREALFDRIGARSFTLEPDAYGNFVITGNVYATARDWARLGLLFLRDGEWNGERLWPAGWRETISTPSPALRAYGGQVWLNIDGRFPEAPRDAFYFHGWLSQIVMIIPSRNVVIVRLGHSDDGSFDPYFNEIVGRTLRALEQSAP